MTINGTSTARMSSLRKAALLAAFVVLPGAAMAADTPGAPAPSASTASGPAEVQPSPEALLLADIRRQTSVTDARADGLEAQIRLRALKASLGQTSGDDSLPQLIGLYGVGNDVTAEFLSGKSLLTVRPGEYVNGRWKLRSVSGNGVVLATREGKTLRMLLGQGGQPQPGAATGMAPRVPSPGGYPMRTATP